MEPQHMEPQPVPPPAYPPPAYPPPYPPPPYPPPAYPPPYPPPYKHPAIFGPCAFETPFPPGDPTLSGSISAYIVDPGGQPATILNINADFEVCVEWELKGSLARLFCGSWCICLFFESLGDCEEFRFPLKPQDCPRVELKCGVEKYKYCFKIPAGTIKVAQCDCPYIIAVTLSLFDKCYPERPAPIAGNCKGPVLQFYNPGP